MLPKFVFDAKSYQKEPTHRRVNSNIVDANSKPVNAHRRTLSNSDLKISPVSSYQQNSPYKSKPQLILPDSLNSSAIQPYLQNEENNFLEVLDTSIKHFTSINTVSNPLKQIADLKSQIAYLTKSIDSLKDNRAKLATKYTSLVSKSQESEQETEKLEEYLLQLKNHTEKLKLSVQKTENDLKILKKKNQQNDIGLASNFRRENRSSTLNKNEKYANSSNDEIDVFNAEENTCMPFSDPFQFANPSPKVLVKNFYSRSLMKK